MSVSNFYDVSGNALVDLYQIFAPYTSGTKASATQYYIAGTDLCNIFAAYSSGTKANPTKIYVGSTATDLADMFAAYGSNSNSLYNANAPILLGQTFNTGSYINTYSGNPIMATNTAQTYMMTVIYNGYIYVSTNGGTVWTQKTNTVDQYSACCLSESGQYMYASCSGTSHFYYSSNYGATWTLSSFGSNLSSCCCSPNGQEVFITDFNGGLYYSSNYGASSSLVQAISNQGLANLIFNDIYCYFTSTNGGVSYKYTASTNTLSTVRAALGTNCSGISMSTSGAFIYTCYYNNATQISRSSDGGATWSSTTISYTGNNYFVNIWCDWTGKYVYVMNYSTSLYYSTNYGATFTSIVYANAFNSLAFDRARTVFLMCGSNGYYMSKSSLLTSMVTSGLTRHYNFTVSDCYSGTGTTVNNLINSTADLNILGTSNYQSSTKTIYLPNTNSNHLSNTSYFRSTTSNVRFNSISIWYKQLPIITTGTSYLFDGRNGAANSWILSTGGGSGTMIGSTWTNIYYDGGTSATLAWYGTEFKNGTWHNITFTSPTNMTGTLTFIGNIIDNAESANIEILAMMVYDRQITQAENAQNYYYYIMNYVDMLPKLSSALSPTMRFDSALNITKNSSNGVSAWGETTNTYSAIQATTANMPIYNSYYINGLPGIVYSGTKLLTASSLPLVGHNIAYYFIVAYITSRTFSNILSGDPNGGLWSSGSTHMVLTSSNFQVSMNTAADLTTNLSIPLNTPFVVMYYYNTNAGGTMYARLNGVSSNKLTHGVTNAQNSQQLDIGGWSPQSRTITGGISEVIIYTSALTDDKVWAIESYLATKYNIAVGQRTI